MWKHYIWLHWARKLPWRDSNIELEIETKLEWKCRKIVILTDLRWGWAVRASLYKYSQLLDTGSYLKVNYELSHDFWPWTKSNLGPGIIKWATDSVRAQGLSLLQIFLYSMDGAPHHWKLRQRPKYEMQHTGLGHSVQFFYSHFVYIFVGTELKLEKARLFRQQCKWFKIHPIILLSLNLKWTSDCTQYDSEIKDSLNCRQIYRQKSFCNV